MCSLSINFNRTCAMSDFDIRSTKKVPLKMTSRHENHNRPKFYKSDDQKIKLKCEQRNDGLFLEWGQQNAA